MFCTKCGKEIDSTSKFCAFCGAVTSLRDPSLAPEPQAHQPFISPPPLTHATTAWQGQPTKSSLHYAGFWLRALALFIDVIISTVIAIIIVLPLAFALGASMAGSSSSSELEAMGEGLGNVIGWIVSWLYFTVSESSNWQATLGKKLLGLKVTDLHGARIGFGKANGRYWSKIISGIIILIGYVMAAFTYKKQALHDMIAGTLVIKS